MMQENTLIEQLRILNKTHRPTQGRLWREEWKAIYDARKNFAKWNTIWELVQSVHPGAYSNIHSFQHSYYNATKNIRHLNKFSDLT